MAVTQSVLGYGTLFKRGNNDGPPETFTTVAEVTNIGGPNLSADLVEVTHMESPSGFKEYIAGLKDGGEVTIDFNFINDTTQKQLVTDLQAGTKSNWKIVWSLAGNPEWTFAGIVTAMGPTAPAGDTITGSATIKISADITV